jgi:hypothetical protein
MLGRNRIRCHCDQCAVTGELFTPKGFECHAGREAVRPFSTALLPLLTLPSRDPFHAWNPMPATITVPSSHFYCFWVPTELEAARYNAGRI